MPIKITAKISHLDPHRFDAACALATVELVAEDAIQSPLTYQFPLPAQVLADGSEIDASSPFAIPGEPDSVELEINCMVLARYWAAQQGWPSAESEIDLTVEGP